MFIMFIMVVYFAYFGEQKIARLKLRNLNICDVVWCIFEIFLTYSELYYMST